ncbi:MAG: hypothetical protein JW891_03585 [Candidatus Lokiarchaeota archaeon]|nr:hypothetical protein [Candidatus Lokiarchaeota archaeon]
MSILEENLKDAIRGESNARRKYQLYAERAKKEGLKGISLLFEAVSRAESVHVKNHLKALSVLTGREALVEDIVQITEEELNNLVGDTRSNLANAMEGERHEFKVMYKTFLKNAKKEGQNVVELTFNLARQAENIHRKLFSRFLTRLEKNKPIDLGEIHVCTICGNVELSKPTSNCPICDHSPKFFDTIRASF